MTTVVVGIIIRAQFNTLGVKRYNHSARKLIFFLSSYQEKTNKCVQSKHFDSLKEKHEIYILKVYTVGGGRITKKEEMIVDTTIVDI